MPKSKQRIDRRLKLRARRSKPHKTVTEFLDIYEKSTTRTTFADFISKLSGHAFGPKPDKYRTTHK